MRADPDELLSPDRWAGLPGESSGRRVRKGADPSWDRPLARDAGQCFGLASMTFLAICGGIGSWPM
jgi:hypothetical protein